MNPQKELLWSLWVTVILLTCLADWVALSLRFGVKGCWVWVLGFGCSFFGLRLEGFVVERPGPQPISRLFPSKASSLHSDWPISHEFRVGSYPAFARCKLGTQGVSAARGLTAWALGVPGLGAFGFT